MSTVEVVATQSLASLDLLNALTMQIEMNDAKVFHLVKLFQKNSNISLKKRQSIRKYGNTKIRKYKIRC